MDREEAMQIATDFLAARDLPTVGMTPHARDSLQQVEIVFSRGDEVVYRVFLTTAGTLSGSTSASFAAALGPSDVLMKPVAYRGFPKYLDGVDPAAAAVVFLEVFGVDVSGLDVVVFDPARMVNVWWERHENTLHGLYEFDVAEPGVVLRFENNTSAGELDADGLRELAGCYRRYAACRDQSDLEGMDAAIWQAWDLHPTPRHGWESSPSTLYDLMAHLVFRGRADEALRLSDEQREAGFALSMQPTADEFRGLALLALGRVEEARDLYAWTRESWDWWAFRGGRSRFVEFAEAGGIPDGGLTEFIDRIGAVVTGTEPYLG